MHQAFFSPPAYTLIKAINNGQLEGIPFMKADLIRKYLAPSPATSKGRMKRQTGIRSTRAKPTTKNATPQSPEEPIPNVASPPHVIPVESTSDSICNVFCYAALADKHAGTMYKDATGALPVVSLEGNQYYFVAYAYDPNYVFALPIPNLRDDTMIGAFKQVFQTEFQRNRYPSSQAD